MKSICHGIRTSSTILIVKFDPPVLLQVFWRKVETCTTPIITLLLLCSNNRGVNRHAQYGKREFLFFLMCPILPSHLQYTARLSVHFTQACYRYTMVYHTTLSASVRMFCSFILYPERRLHLWYTCVEAWCKQESPANYFTSSCRVPSRTEMHRAGV